MRGCEIAAAALVFFWGLCGLCAWAEPPVSEESSSVTEKPCGLAPPGASASCCAATAASRREAKVYFQAHRGGLREVPEHTLETYQYAWDLGGIPEADIHTSRDGVILCLHDKTLARTTNAPEPVRNQDVATLGFEEVRRWDAGVMFDASLAGQKVPALSEVFEQLRSHPERQLYLDLKRVDLEALGRLIEEYGVGGRIIFAHNVQDNLIRFSRIVPKVRTMLWIGGKPEEIKARFDRALRSGFEGLSQVQLHLHSRETEQGIEYLLEEEFLQYALEQTQEAGLDLEVLPFEFDDASLHRLLEQGLRWYATDYPKRFAGSVDRWRKGI